MKFYSVNPATGQKIKQYEYLNRAEIKKKIQTASLAYEKWSNTTISSRIKIIFKAEKILLANKKEYAGIMTLEMGKNIAEATAEIEKCAWVCRYYAQNAKDQLKPKKVKTDAANSFVRYDPLGVILSVMPWNFPFWQVFRAATPALAAGNTMLLKHASSVPACALLIEDIWKKAGAPYGVFQTLIVRGKDVPGIITNPAVKKISLTGSEQAGASVAREAGANLKPTVLELGGSDPFIVFEDADFDLAVNTAVASRLIVSGQSCIAAKRFIVHKSIYQKFISHFTEILRSKSDIAPLINEEAIKILDGQVKKSIALGAKLHVGGTPLGGVGFYYPATVLSEVTPRMPVFKEETFGPVAAVMAFTSLSEAVYLANHSRFGLGASVWTKNKQTIEYVTEKIEAGSVFVNSMVKSDPRLPFGGTKYSGYGRELSIEGLHEYTNIKTVWIN